jgi:hypothetical protein
VKRVASSQYPVASRRTAVASGREAERGYALLFVFLMAAVVALYLYTQLPRVAFESERDKEQTLIDRGEQYKRAIQLYVGALKKYPQKIEDLENTNEKRYLRRRYIDPMTGKDEWRLIHVNAAGQLTDSLVQAAPCGALAPGSGTPGSTASSTPSSGASTTAPPNNSAGGCAASASGPGGNASASATGTTTATAANAGTATDPNDVNAAVRRRPSDVVGQAYTQPANADPNDPSTWAPITLATPGAANGQPPSGAVGFNGGLLGQTPGQVGVNGQPGIPMQGGAPGTPGAFPLPGQPGFNPTQNQFKIDANGQLVPVTPTLPGQAPVGSQQAGSQPVGSQIGTTPYQQPGSQPVAQQAFGAQPGGNAVNPITGVAPQNSATTAINQMLTNPNPAAGGLGTSGGMTTGGIAGVASTFKGPSIKIYGTRQKYQEWEFIFSMNNQNGTTGQAKNPLGAQPGTQGGNGTTAAPGAGTTAGSPTGN